MSSNIKFWHTKGTGIATVLTIDTARLVRRLDNAVRADQDGLRRTNLCAWCQRFLAMHTQRWRRGHAIVPLHKVDIDHTLTLMCIAFATGRDARAAPDAARRVKEDSFYRFCHSTPYYCNVGVGFVWAMGSSRRRLRAAARACISSSLAHSGACSARVAEAAHTLYSGILNIGSNTGLVS